ncbi:Sorting nexin-18 [Paragonimus heterotremus]|uniref:Sorting nexin-18 n=1 Tax=Paragonimus heterotremus TaxID=100268 RepID=A0A8J4SRF4_9TREM|nr:Sorting nexin-18 [Paragonimus heterotremus]
MRARVIYDFSAQGDGELSVACGEEVTIIDQSVGDGWWNAVNAFGRSGLVPSSFVEPFDLPEPAVPPPPPPTFVSQSPDWDEDWDSDDSAPGSEPPRTPLEKTSNGGPHRSSNGPLPSDNTWKHSGSIGSVPPYSDSIRTAPIRRYFNRTHIRSGAEDFLLRIEPPPSPRTEAVIEYANGMFIWQPASSVIQCKISSFHKDSKMKGMKSFIAYQLTSQLVPSHVNRRYKHFDWLHARLLSKYPCVCIPPLPEKAITGRYDDDFVDERRKGLQQWLDRMCRHPVVSQCEVLRHFLSCTDEKRWKQGKREAETDRLQGIRYYYAVVSKEPLQKEDYSTAQAEGTEKFAVELERGVRALSDTINDFHRKLSTNTRKDFISLSGAFYGMCRALDGDTHSKHLNSHLYAALSNVGETFKSISLCHAVESESFVQLNDCLREYVRVLSTLPPVVSLGKFACLTADEVRRLLSEEKLSKQDASNILSGSLVITRALQAECNLIMSQLRQELLERVKAYLTDRANFYRQLAAQLDSVASVF